MVTEVSELVWWCCWSPFSKAFKHLCGSVTVPWPLILQTAGRCYCRSEKERREILLLILLVYYWTNKTAYSRLLTQIFLQIINFQRAGGDSSCHFLFMYYLDAREPFPGIYRPDKYRSCHARCQLLWFGLVLWLNSIATSLMGGLMWNSTCS